MWVCQGEGHFEACSAGLDGLVSVDVSSGGETMADGWGVGVCGPRLLLASKPTIEFRARRQLPGIVELPTPCNADSGSG